MSILTVLLVDDERKVLRAWERALERDRHDLHLASSFAEGVRFITELATVHVALLDMRLPGEGSGELLHDVLRRFHPSAGAAVVSAHFDEETRKRLVSRKIKVLDKPLPGLSRLVVELWPGQEPGSGSGSSRTAQADVMEIVETCELTPRETQVFQGLAAGRSTEEIAEQLHLSVETVRKHEQSIRQKMDKHSKAELLATILRHMSQN
jgi:DNA-binding NarL/FixJ family response regulator